MDTHVEPKSFRESIKEHPHGSKRKTSGFFSNRQERRVRRDAKKIDIEPVEFCSRVFDKSRRLKFLEARANWWSCGR